MKGLYCCILSFAISFSSFCQTIESSGLGSGAWSDPLSWSPNTVPTRANSTLVRVNPAHTITVTDTRSIDQLQVQGTLIISSGVTFTIADGNDPDAVISGLLTNNGTLAIENDFGTVAVVQVSGTIENTNTINGAAKETLVFAAGGMYIHNRDDGTIPAATWNDASECRVVGTVGTPPGGLAQNFGNFVWNTPALDVPGNLANLGFTALTSFDGTFEIQHTNGKILVFSDGSGLNININNLTVSGTGRFAVTNSGSVSVTINGTFEYSSGSPSYFANTGTGTINQKGPFVFSDGIMIVANVLGTGNLVFNAPSSTNPPSTFDNTGGGSFDGTKGPNITIASFSRLDMVGESAFDGTGDFNLQADATIGVSSVNGLSASSGNVLVSGARNYIAESNIVYISGGPQALGTEWGSGGALAGIAVNLKIDNGSVVTNNNTGSTNLVGVLSLINGTLNIGGSNLLDVQSSFESTPDGYFGGSTTSDLTFSGSGSVGQVNFAEGAAVLDDLTISRSGTIPLGTDLAIEGILAFESNGNLDFSGSTLMLQGNNSDITTAGFGGGLISDNTSNLLLTGSGSVTSIPFFGSGNQLNNLTFNRTGSSTYTWDGAVVVNGNVNLAAGTLTHTSGLSLASTATFIRTSQTSISSAPNAIDGTYNVSYNGSGMATGPELIPNGVNNLTIANAGSVTLDKAITVAGELTINGGTFNTTAHNLTIAGPAFRVNGGSFTMSSTRTITFSYAGTTLLTGSTVGGTQFGNLTINSGTSLNAPNGNINVSGTWLNDGTFVPNNGTVTFNGSNQVLDPNGQPFYHVAFANSGTKSLDGDLDVNGDLTIAEGVTLDANGADNVISIAGIWANSGIFIHSSNTVLFDGMGQSITETGSFYTLQLAGSGTKTLGAPLDVDGNLIINSGVTFSPSLSAINVGGNWINNGTFTTPGTGGLVTFDGNSSISGSSTTRFRNITLAGAVTAPATTMEVAGDWVHQSGTFNANGGTIIFNGLVSQSITPNGRSFNNVTIAGSNTKTLQGNLDVNGNLILSAATLDVNNTNYAVNVAGNFDASGGGILNARAGTFAFDGLAQSITSAGQQFFNVTFSGSNTKSLQDGLDVNGSLTVSSTLAAGANSINVAGNWSDTGTFTTSGVTTFDGVDQTILTSGSSFAVLNLAGSGTKTLQDALVVNSDLTVTSALDVSATNYTVSVGGDWDFTGGSFNARAGAVRLNGGIQSITSAGSPFYELRIAGTGTKTLQDPLDVDADLIFVNGTSALDVGADEDINVAGNWINDSGIPGAFIPGNGTVTFDGGAITNVRGTGTTLFHSIDVTGTTRVEIETAHNLKGTLSLVGASAQFDAQGTSDDGVFTLISSDDDPTVDGRIAALVEPDNFTGDVTIQRYMSQESMPTLNDTRLYRYISSPVANAPVSQIQAEIPITGTFTGASSCSGCIKTSQSMFAYDEGIGTTFDDGWVDFPSLSNTEVLEQGVGYAIFVRGDIIPSALWDVRGPVFTGDLPSPQLSYDPHDVPDADGFNLVGNPYPSAIDWNLVYQQSSGLANAIYMLDNPNGVYAQVVGGVSSNGGTTDIAMGQAFWVQAIASNPSMPFSESMKTSNSTTFFREATPTDLLRITLGQSSLRDEIVIRFKDEASDSFDANYDAWKLTNRIFNLSSLTEDGRKLSINTLGAMGCGRELNLDVSNVSTGHYELSLAGVESFSDQVSIRLFDAYRGEMIDARTTASYGFDVDAKQPASFGKERFKVIFEFNGSMAEPELFAANVCEGNDALVEIGHSTVDVTYAVYASNSLVADAGFGNGSTLNIAIPKDKLSAGVNTFELRAVNALCDQVSIVKEFEVANEVIPEIASAKSSSACLAGVVDLEASGGQEGNYRWYEAADDIAPIAGATTSIFTTPVLAKSKTYFVSAVNALGCEGTRVEVLAEIVNFEPVAVSENEEGQLVSSYATGNQWFLDGEIIEGATDPTFTPTESGTYAVEVKVGECTTSAQQMYLVTANEEQYSNGGLNIYPNPVQNRLVIESRFEQVEAPLISDPTGKVLGSVLMVPSGGGWVGTFDFTGAARGVYILKITEKGVSRYKRIVRE